MPSPPLAVVSLPPAMVNATDTASVSGVVSNGLRADAAVSCRPVSCCATPDGNGVMVTATVTASSCAGVSMHHDNAS